MSRVISLAFQTAKLEKSFSTMIQRQNRPLHGLIFMDIDHIIPMHYMRHQRVFGINNVGVISNYLVAPNGVSDGGYLAAMAQLTVSNSMVYIYPWSYTPNGSWMLPDKEKMSWWTDFKEYSWAAGVNVYIRGKNERRLELNRSEDGRNWNCGGFYSWRYIRYLLKKARKEGVQV